MRKIRTMWKNFWGNKYWIYENNILTKEILVYHKKIYIKNIAKGR